MASTRNQQLIFAYSLLFTVAAGAISLDLTSRPAKPVIADVPVPQVQAAVEAPAPDPVAGPVPLVAKAEPDPARVVAAPAAATPAIEKRVAPPGVLFMTARVSQATNAGIAALTPGTRVKIMYRKGTKVTVTDGRNEFIVDEGQTTKDVDLAEQLARQLGTTAALNQK